MIYKAQDELDTALAYWQDVLSVRDWDVRARIVRADAMKIEGAIGTCFRTSENRTAYIQLLDPIDYPETCLWEQCHEKTLVHELLHIHTGWVMDEIYGVNEALHSRLNTQVENIITALDKAFVRLNRKN